MFCTFSKEFFNNPRSFCKEATATGINLTLASGKSALHLAAEKGDARVLRLLLAAQAQLDAATSTGRSALHVAVEHDYEQAVQVRKLMQVLFWRQGEEFMRMNMQEFCKNGKLHLSFLGMSRSYIS